MLLTAWATLTSIRLPDMEEPFLDLGDYNFIFVPVMIGILGNLVLMGVGLAVSLLGRLSAK